MALTLSLGHRRAIQWVSILIGILVVAWLTAPRAVLPVSLQASSAQDDPFPWLAPCSKLSAHHLLEPPAPVSHTPTTTVANPTATPVPPTPRPAPQEDRVGFPAGYGETFRLLVVFDRPDNKQVRALCANELAAGIAPGKSFPYGSVLVMETWRAKLDHNGNPVLDANGRFIRETLSGVFVMREEQGFGQAYGLDRSGEAEHTVVTTGAFASKPLKTRLAKPGDHFSVTYVSPGSFPYFCSIHPAMKGDIEVRS